MKQKWSIYLVLLLLMGVGVSKRPLYAADAVVSICTEAAFNTALTTVQNSGSGTITFNCGGPATIIFTTGKVISNADVTINGGSTITLSGGNLIRPFYVDSNGTLTLQNITVSNGLDNTYGGGAILSLGELTLENTTIRDSNVNSAYSGGAIMSLGGLVTITNSLIENNTGGSAGGLYLFGENADATITDSTFRNNRTTNYSYGYGGAITPWDGADVTIYNSTLEQNQAQRGGAIYNQSANTLIILRANTVLDGNSAGVGGGIHNAQGAMSLTDTVLSNNVAEEAGGGIYNDLGSLSALDVVLSNNRITYGDGGGIYNSGSVNLTQTVLSTNWAEFKGGGIFNQEEGSMTLSDTILRNNSSEIGGGIFNQEGSMTISNTVLRNNSSETGGGISSFGSMTISNTVLNNNTADYSGGGIYNGGDLDLTNVTISGNSVTTQSEMDSKGGGIRNQSGGSVSLIHTTFSGNSANNGGAIYQEGVSVSFKNVILMPGIEGRNCVSFGVMISNGFNLDRDGSCGLNQVGDQKLVDPLLGPLMDNGGFTPTHMLLPGSPAINTGQCVSGLMTDQRGLPRLQGAACDIGAVERQPDDGGYFVYLPLVIK